MRRAQVIAEARRWIDTPYRHQASCRGAGSDCLGLIRGIWRELCGAEPLPLPPYTPNWDEATDHDRLLSAARSCFTCVDKADTQPGDIMLFLMTPRGACKHIAVRASAATIIHAYWGRAVVESYLVPYWQKRHAYSFAFPEISERRI